jgi:hypothetical protein
MEGDSNSKKLVLSGERLSIYHALQRRSERIARMYIGAHYALNDNANPERLCCAAHEIRELMEKVPEIVDIRAVSAVEIKGKVRELSGAYEAAVGKTLLSAPNWGGTVDSAMAKLLEQMREFMEWVKTNVTKRGDDVLNMFRPLDGPGRVLPPDLEEEMMREWKKMRRFFQNVSHHQYSAKPEEFENQLQALELFLLRKFSPPTFPNFDEIDAIIEEGEGEAKP